MNKIQITNPRVKRTFTVVTKKSVGGGSPPIGGYDPEQVSAAKRYPRKKLT